MKKLITLLCLLTSITVYSKTVEHCINQYGEMFCFSQVNTYFFTTESDLPLLEMNRDIKELDIEFIVIDNHSYKNQKLAGIIYYGYSSDKGLAGCMMEGMEGFENGFLDGFESGGKTGAAGGAVVGATAGGIATGGAGVIPGAIEGAKIGAVVGGLAGGVYQGGKEGVNKYNECKENENNIQDKPGR